MAEVSEWSKERDLRSLAFACRGFEPRLPHFFVVVHVVFFTQIDVLPGKRTCTGKCCCWFLRYFRCTASAFMEKHATMHDMITHDGLFICTHTIVIRTAATSPVTIIAAASRTAPRGTGIKQLNVIHIHFWWYSRGVICSFGEPQPLFDYSCCKTCVSGDK